jgi:hypothetical protein
VTTTPHEPGLCPSPLVPRAGETIITFHNWTVHVISTMCETYPLLRPALIAVALVGSKITYKGLAMAVNSPTRSATTATCSPWWARTATVGESRISPAWSSLEKPASLAKAGEVTPRRNAVGALTTGSGSYCSTGSRKSERACSSGCCGLAYAPRGGNGFSRAVVSWVWFIRYGAHPWRSAAA